MSGRDELAGFVGELRHLRRLAGAPSLNRLAELANRANRSLPRSTISDKLAGKSLPSWEFVVAFVAACAAHAEANGTPLSPTTVDLPHWEQAHWRLLQAVDSTRTDERLAVAAQIERQRRGTPESDTSLPAPETGFQHHVTAARQLPVPPRHFVGRDSELAMLNTLAQVAQIDGGVAIAAIDGTAGVGKTALAVHWAHRVAHRFPDGQLYLDLRGFDPAGCPTPPEVALRGFLDALGVPPHRLPADLDAQLGLYRSLLFGKRVLVVLDNARDVAQVRPLLPGAPGSTVVVTSRHRLAGLIAVEGAQPITLDLLDVDGAQAVLAGRLGAARVANDPASAEVIVRRCARLPLSLAVVATRAAARPRLPLSTLAAELRDAHDVLDATTVADDVYADARTVFSWSCPALSRDAAHLLRLVGLHPGPEISIAATASLAGMSRSQARRLLAELACANLVEERAPGRFWHHDLLRAWTIELAQEAHSAARRAAAMSRLLDHYLHTAYAAQRLLHPQRQGRTLTAPVPGALVEHFTDDRAAATWVMTEYRVLLAVFEVAVAAGLDTHVWQLAQILFTCFERPVVTPGDGNGRAHPHHIDNLGHADADAIRRRLRQLEEEAHELAGTGRRTHSS